METRERALCRVRIALTSISTGAILSLPCSGRREVRRDCDQPAPSTGTDISPVSESGNREPLLSMSHQRACSRTAVDVTLLPLAFTLVEK